MGFLWDLWVSMGFFQRRQWQPTPVLLPGKSHGRRGLVGCRPWGREELDTTEQLHFHFHALEKEMATHSSVLAWRIPGMGEPGGPPSMGSHRVRLGWSDLAAAAAWERLIMPSLEISVSHSIKWFKWHYKSFMRIPISSKHYLKVKIKI